MLRSDVKRLVFALAVGLALMPIVTLAAPGDDVRSVDQLVVQAQNALAAGDVQSARQAYTTYRGRWTQIEDGVRDASPDQYSAIEAAQREVRTSLLADPPDTVRATRALATLHEHNQAFVQSSATASAQPQTAATDAERLTVLVGELDAARAALARNDVTAATASLDAFQRDWPSIEGLVKAKSPAAYTATEDDMADAQAALASPASQPNADAILARMRDRLEPIAQSGTSYSIFDAFVIMLREGLEALLVVGALTAFVNRSGDRSRRGLVNVWGGAAVGIALSVLVAILLQQLFSRAGAGLGFELVEGYVGLIAAAMLFYVSYWLHSKSKLGAWQRYIEARSSSALARGSMFSLGVISFLAVLREGAETAVFYLGIAPSIAPGDLLIGLGLGVLALLLVGAAVLLVGMRLPMRPFFLASSALIYYLGFKFLGTGLHSLQVAGVLPATPAPVPSSDLLGVYPTWETLLPQLALLCIAAGVLWLSLRGSRSTFAAV